MCVCVCDREREREQRHLLVGQKSLQCLFAVFLMGHSEHHRENRLFLEKLEYLHVCCGLIK